MDVVNLSSEKASAHCEAETRVTDEELEQEYGFYYAEKIADRMLSEGLITQGERARIKQINVEKYLPILEGLKA